MANSPFDTDGITFGLKFKSLGRSDWYMIEEFVFFDSAKVTREQEQKRFSRQKRYLELDKAYFPKKDGRYTGVNQIKNPQGDSTDGYLDYGIEWLIPIYKEFGFEMDVEVGIFFNGTVFQSYQIDAKGKDITDGYTYFQCALIDNSKVADYKRRYDDKLNAFATKGIFEQTVTPIQTLNYLRRAIPINQVSRFRSNNTQCAASSAKFITSGLGLTGFDLGANNANVVEEYGIDDTLGFISNEYATVLGFGGLYRVPNNSLNFTYLEAKNDLTDVSIEITNISAVSSGSFTSNSNLSAATGKAKLLVVIGNDLETEAFEVHELWSRSFSKANPSGNIAQAVPTTLTLALPYIERGKRVYIYFTTEITATWVDDELPTPIGASCIVILNSMDIKITAVATALDTVLKGVRYVDLMKQGNKMVHDLPFNAAKFDVGGQFYDQICFNKRMVSQNTDFLYFTNKQIFESLEEVCADVEISEDEMFIAQYEDFYTNDEIGVYTEVPSEGLTIDVNDRFACNKYKFDYSTFAQDRTLNNTSEAVHTQSEWKLQNTKVENVKEIKNDLVRDPFAIQDIVDLEISKPTTSTDSDNTLCIEDMIQLAPGSFGFVNSRLNMRIANNKLEILNRTLEQDSGNVVINWTVLGFGVGSTIQIVSGQNVGNYVVFAVTNSVLTLTPISTVVTFEGNGFVRLKYFYTGVLWQTRTNEGFTLIDGVTEKFANLRYTIKRNMFHWYKYIASMLMYSKKDIINSFFKSNGALKTRLTTESVDVVENGTILYSDLPTPILTGNIINLTVASDFNTEIDYLNAYKTTKGFVRCLDLQGNVIKGYVQKAGFNAQSNQLDLVLEEKYEAQILTVSVSGSDLVINDTTYQMSGNAQWFRFDNDYVKFYDINNKPICNFYKYNFVLLNNSTYSSANDLATALNALI